MTAMPEAEADDLDGIPLDVVDHVAEIIDGNRIVRAWQREGRTYPTRWNVADSFWRDVLRRLAVRSIRSTATQLGQGLPVTVGDATEQRELLARLMTRRRERQVELAREASRVGEIADRYALALDPPFSEAIRILAETKEGEAADA